MAALHASVRFTANFEANLASIAAFWEERNAPHAYSSLLDELGTTVIGNLERHPRIGRNFFARSAHSSQAQDRVVALRSRFGDTEVREYLSGDCLLLYCLVAEPAPHTPGLTAHLLAIKHHRQLSFDFEGFWQANRSEDV